MCPANVIPSTRFSLKNFSLSTCLAGGGGIDTAEGSALGSDGSKLSGRISGRCIMSPKTGLTGLRKLSGWSSTQAFPFRILKDYIHKEQIGS